MTLALFAAGLLLLIVGAQLLVSGAARLASGLGLPPLVIGLTVVAWGTGAPELAVSVQSTLLGVPPVALGNVVGSNIFNVLVVLGLSALLAPLAVPPRVVRSDVPIMIGASITLLLVTLDRRIGPLDGLVLLASMAAYTGWVYYRSRDGDRDALGGDDRPAHAGGRITLASALVQLLLVVAGLVTLTIGSRWLVDAAVAIAAWLGVGELVVGLTIVAVGTSLPEVATSVIASLRRELDIAVGNIVGSNIFNILGVLGLSSLVAPGGLPVSSRVIRLDIPVMIAVALVCLPVMLTGNRVDRWEGAAFLFYYAAFLAYLLLEAIQHAAFPAYGLAVRVVLIPLTVVGVTVVTALAYRERRPGDL